MTEKGIVSEILKQKFKKEASPSSKESIKRTSIALPEDLYRRLKAYAALEGRKLNELMVELLGEALERRLAKKKIFFQE